MDSVAASTAAKSSGPAIEIRGLSKAFGEKSIYEGLDFTLERGEILTVLGGSGTGKSVMLKMILGLMDWDAGSVKVNGIELSGLSEQAMVGVRRDVGMVFQQSALFDSLTVYENIAFPLRERGIRDEERIRSRVAEVLAQVDMAGTEPMMPADLSGGMRKRVATARAISGAPSIILYDEPTTGLDPINVRRLVELIRSLRRNLGVTSIVVTHDLQAAYMVSDRLAFLGQRKILDVGSVAAIRQSRVEEVREFLFAMDASAGASVDTGQGARA
jgi:phospholipid/cholesterol/gamma-HCH transport system ATP-binding protein